MKVYEQGKKVNDGIYKCATGQNYLTIENGRVASIISRKRYETDKGFLDVDAPIYSEIQRGYLAYYLNDLVP